ncbi:hypothetical protein DERF_002553 [Dermatophagoides farinae]|uniref:Uncharacterized protein n=1 Tax=Dermatophagoides farinae TaxID=6954 RepID=A0A922IBU1_DERFA|nr:hypothetical protein DERF_002553 [Dermatophagoides farinae]
MENETMMNIGNQSEKGLIIDNEDDGEISEKMPSSDSNQSSKQIAEKDEPPNKRTKQDRWIYSTIDDGGNNDGSETQPKQDKKDDDNQSLDEGEIVDDDDDEVCLKNQSNSTSKLPIDDDDDDKFEEGECNDQLIKNSNDNDTGKQKDQADEIASNYSDWSESEDDLLKADNTQQESKIDTIQKVDKTTLSVKGNNDLEAISDDDIDTIADDISNNNKTGANVEKLLQQKESNEIVEKDLEEISILDILKIDWKSLIVENETNIVNNETTNDDDLNPADIKSTLNKDEKETKKQRSEKFRQKNSTIAMLNRIGFSQKFAGPDVTAKINDYLARELGAETYRPMLHPVPALHSFYLSKQQHNDHDKDHSIM